MASGIKELVKNIAGKSPSDQPPEAKPMLASLAKEFPEGDDWIYELKWDGFRAMAVLLNNRKDLFSRNQKNFNQKYYPIYNELLQFQFNVVLDGEIVVLDKNGYPDFAALQQWRSEADGNIVYYVFDILWLEGLDLLKVPYSERRSLLEKIIPEKGIIRINPSLDAEGPVLFEAARKMSLEGIIAKKGSSSYAPGIRSKDWLKIKTQAHQELIVGGYTVNENSSKKFSSLLLGMYIDHEFVFTTVVGTGFTVKLQQQLLEKFNPLLIDYCPFANEPEYNKPSRFRPNPVKAEVYWVKPEVVVEIAYSTLSPDGSFRHPSFRGIREDKSPEEVVPENHDKEYNMKEKDNRIGKHFVASEKEERKSLLNPTEETQVKIIEGRSLKFPNLSKLYWPDDGISKRDMLNYYYQVAPFILPYIKDRPQTLNRFPNGIYGSSFYQKDLRGKAPEWLDTFEYYSETDKRLKNFPVVTDEAGLLYLASLGCIEINPWSSRKDTPDHPDWCIIDLDPDGNPFSQVIETARIVKTVLESAGAECYCKTTGSSGLHIYIPLEAKYTYEESKEFGRVVAKVVHALVPGYTSIERYTKNRKGKLYIDFLQNRPQATVASVYSLRPKPGAPVSMPVHWDEVSKGLRPDSFNLKNAVLRLKETGDLFTGVLGKGIDLYKVRENLEEGIKTA